MKIGYQRDSCTPKFIAALFTVAKIRNNPNVCQWMSGNRRYVLKNMYIHTHANIYTHVCTDIYMGFPGGSMRKNLPATAGDMGSIPRLGRSPRRGNGNPLQYSCLENAMQGAA